MRRFTHHHPCTQYQTIAMTPMNPPTSCTRHQDLARPDVVWRRVRGSRALRHAVSACQAMRTRAGECHACRNACPVEAIELGAATLEVADHCLGCGRCVPACPMGALELPILSQSCTTGCDALEIDCRRVPPAAHSVNANTVPCLGALDEADLLELFTAADGRQVRLLDRGWCADCPAGGDGTHPVQTALDAARHWLTLMGVPATRQPRLVAAPMDNTRALPATAEVLGEAVLSRRGFFRQFARAAQDKSQPPPRQRPSAQVGAHASLARERRLDAIDQVAAMTHQAAPAAARPQLSARSERCCNHQGCIRICPTGAVRAYRTQQSSGVRFDAAACIACDLCVRHCPQAALYWTTAAVVTPPMSYTLTSHARRECAGCGAEFSPRPGETASAYCLPCQRSRRLAADAFAQLFGASG